MILFEILILNFLKKASNSLFAMTAGIRKEGIHEFKSLESCGPSLLSMSVNNIDKRFKMY